jgi:hypothetical protein
MRYSKDTTPSIWVVINLATETNLGVTARGVAGEGETHYLGVCSA